jgi:beta-phosphoglucomutase-like phosphatase (HAD superfamily)
MISVRKSRPTTHADANRVSVRRPDPEVWRQALELAGGDHHRLDVQQDGAVVVRNQKSR